jgi:hypothetical protein
MRLDPRLRPTVIHNRAIGMRFQFHNCESGAHTFGCFSQWLLYYCSRSAIFQRSGEAGMPCALIGVALLVA